MGKFVAKRRKEKLPISEHSDIFKKQELKTQSFYFSFEDGETKEQMDWEGLSYSEKLPLQSVNSEHSSDENKIAQQS